MQKDKTKVKWIADQRKKKEERRKKKRNNDYDLYTIWYGNELNFQYLANFDYYDRNGVVTAAVAAAAACC